MGRPVNVQLWDVGVVDHENLADEDLAGLQTLFDAEYFAEHGPWSSESPYGYAGHDVHVIARDGDAIVGHVGWARRVIGVGDREVVIAGVGGVLVAPSARGTSLGRHLLSAAVGAMRRATGIEYGYLGCREAVAAFYASCGWTRIEAEERYVDRATGQTVEDAAGAPLFIRGVQRREAEWPTGLVDLRGRPW